MKVYQVTRAIFNQKNYHWIGNEKSDIKANTSTDLNAFKKAQSLSRTKYNIINSIPLNTKMTDVIRPNWAPGPRSSAEIMPD